MSYFVPTRFQWRFGGSQVHLCGSFTRWVETVPMVPVEGQPGTFSVVVHLPPGYHQYKFIVDGEWRHDETQPFMPDPLGNVNNWLFVRKPEPSPPPPSQLTAQLQQQLQQQQQHQIRPQHPVSQQQNIHFLHPAALNHLNMSPTGPSGANIAPSSQPSTLSATTDMEVIDGGVVPPIAAEVDEPGFTRRKVKEFLSHHTAYELIPESGKVVVLDVDLPLRQAFHALHEQGIASGPLYDYETGNICGIISASDFIETLKRMRSLVSSSANPMSEAEMDQHTIRGLREELAAEGRPPRTLVHVAPTDSLASVVQTLADNHCSMAPVMLVDDSGSAHTDVNGLQVLHTATLSGVVGCLMRHFRASLASLPLLAQPLRALPVGTWSPDSTIAAAVHGDEAAESEHGGTERRDTRKFAPLRTVTANTVLTDAMGMLLDCGMSSLPVVDDRGALVDVFARADVTILARGNAYSRLQFEDVTVGHALALAAAATPPPQILGGGTSPASSVASMQEGTSGSTPKQRVWACTAEESLRGVLERLAVPGVRRVFVVNHETRKVEGIVSLSDIAAFLLA